MHLTSLAAVCLLVVGQPFTPAWFGERASVAEEHAKNGSAKEAMAVLKDMSDKAGRLGANEFKEEMELFTEWKKGVCEFWLGDLGQSVKTLEAIENREKNRFFRHFFYIDLGDAFLDLGRSKAADPCFEKGLALAEKSNKKFEPAELLRIRLSQVRCKLNLGEFEDANNRLVELEAPVFETKAKIEKATPEQTAVLQAEWQILKAETDLNDRNLVSALNRLEKTQKNLVSFPDNKKAVFQRFRCLLGLAKDYWLLARFENSGAHLKSAEEIVKSGKLYRTELGQADIKNAWAGLTLEEAHLAIEEETPPAKLMANLDRAEKNLNDAIAHHDKINRGQDMFTAAVNFHRSQIQELRGRVMALAGQPADVIKLHLRDGQEHCDAALKNLQANLHLPDNHDRVLEVRNRRAWLNLRQGNAKAARDEASAALKLFEDKRGKMNIDRGRYLHVLMTAENTLGNTAEAVKYAQEHRRLLDKGLGAMLTGLSASEQTQFFRRWDTPGLHTSLRIGIQHGSKDQEIAADSLEWLINGKAKLVEVLAAQTQSTRNVNFQAFKDYLTSVKRQAYFLYGEPTTDEKIVQVKYLVEESRKRELAAQASKQIAPKPHWYTLAEVRENLKEDELFLGVFCLRPRETATRVYQAWLVTKSGPVQMVELGEAKQIDQLVRTFLREQERVPLVAPGQERQAEEHLRQVCLDELSRRVFHPILKLANGKQRWIISPDGQLWNIPWAALLLPEGRYAIDQVTFRYAVSGQDLVAPRGMPSLGEPLVLGDPYFNFPDTDRQRLRKPGIDPLRLPWDRLEYSRRECETVLAIMEDSKMKPNRLIGMMRKEQLLELPRPPRLVYLSTHAFATMQATIDVDDPMLTCALAFAGWNYVPDKEQSLPGMMTGAEVMGIDLRGTELVVLASCESSGDALLYGQSPANLRHAFHLAGARAVVSALWGINDRSTMELMEPFMESVCRRNPDKVGALRDAQHQLIRYLRTYRDHTHPYYWAGFTISGS